jgi:8-amino-7-oxononanoate synthase
LHLQQLINYFQKRAQDLKINILPSQTPIQAIVFSDINQLMQTAQALSAKNILISAIRPPTVPKESPRLRITLTAAHQFTDIDRLLMELTAHE